MAARTRHVDQTPAVGSIAEWNGGDAGHVAYVEENLRADLDSGRWADRAPDVVDLDAAELGLRRSSPDPVSDQRFLGPGDDPGPIESWPVNTALRELGADRRTAADEAAAIGLRLPHHP